MRHFNTFYVMTNTRHCAMSAIHLSLTSNTCEEAVSYLHSKEVIFVSTQIQTDQRALLFSFLYHSPALKKAALISLLYGVILKNLNKSVYISPTLKKDCLPGLLLHSIRSYYMY